MDRKYMRDFLDATAMEMCSARIPKKELPIESLIRRATKEALEHRKLREAIRIDHATLAK